MATRKKNGKWLARVQVQSTNRSDSGASLRRDLKKTFDTKSRAEAWERQQRRQFRSVGAEGVLTSDQLEEYRAAKRLARGRDLCEVMDEWAAHNPAPKTVTVTVADALTAYEASKEWERLARKTQGDRRSKVRQFREAFGPRVLSDLTLADIQAYVDGIPNLTTRNNHIRFIKRFFRWSLGAPHRFLTHTPTELLEEEPEERTTPAFIVLEDVRKLFDHAVATDTGLIPFLALGFFAGIRTEEILRMERRDFLFEDRRIHLRPEVAKRKAKGRPLPRLLEGLPETAWKWLEAVGFDGALDSVNLFPRRRRLYTQAGVAWIHSGARHSFCTYAYAKLQEAGRVRKWTGHRRDDTVFLTYYAGLETRARGEAYFKILPPALVIEPKRATVEQMNRADWPADAKLLAWAEREPMTRIARELGVTEAAVRKRLRKIRERAQ